MIKILVTGSNGQLGSELQYLSVVQDACSWLFVNRDQLNITDEAAVQQFFALHQPDYCINCAAYTAVDKAETEQEMAFLVNATAAGYLAKACKVWNARLLHISTDYVFDGTATEPYTEAVTTHPINVYGASKLKGEKLIEQYNPDAIILRTSWVYSSYGNNFIKTMLRLFATKEEISVVNDQVGNPTYAADLAKAILAIIAQTKESANAWKPGIYHYSGEGITSWFAFAQEIKRMVNNTTCTIHPIPSAQYKTPATRPAYSVLNKEKIKQTFHITIPAWQTSVEDCVRRIMQYIS